MLSRYKERHRDFIFLIDQLSYTDFASKQSMQESLKQIFDDHVKDEDRLCLIKFGAESYARTVFSLVKKGLNAT